MWHSPDLEQSPEPSTSLASVEADVSKLAVGRAKKTATRMSSKQHHEKGRHSQGSGPSAAKWLESAIGQCRSCRMCKQMPLRKQETLKHARYRISAHGIQCAAKYCVRLGYIHLWLLVRTTRL